MSKRHWNNHIKELKEKLIEAFEKANICCVHNDGDDEKPCSYTTTEAIKIIEQIMG